MDAEADRPEQNAFWGLRDVQRPTVRSVNTTSPKERDTYAIDGQCDWRPPLGVLGHELDMGAEVQRWLEEKTVPVTIGD